MTLSQDPQPTEYERDVLTRLAQGLTPTEIGKELHLTRYAVSKRIQQLRRRLGHATTWQTVMHAAAQGWVAQLEQERR